MKEKEKDKKQEGDSNILVAIRVRPLNQRELSQSESDIIRAQDNLIVPLISFRLSWTQWRPSSRVRTANSWMCCTALKNSVTRSTRYIETNRLRRSMRRQ